jgi:hypothetical protein
MLQRPRMRNHLCTNAVSNIHGPCALGLIGMMLTAGCGALRQAQDDMQPPIGAPGATPQTTAVAVRAVRGTSWMRRDAATENLLYVADPGTGGVLVYSYRPARYKFVGFLSGTEPTGLCVDRAQNVYVPDASVTGSKVVFEYVHGASSPIRILGIGGTPEGCAVDPTTGNLAVIAYGGSGFFVAIFRHARGKPAIYTDSGFGGITACTYDDKGNLFMDGDVNSDQLPFAEMPKGSSRFKNISLDQTFYSAGGVQWNGKHVVIGDATIADIYEFDIVGSKGTEVGVTPINGSSGIGDFFIASEPYSRVIVPSAPFEGGGFVSVYGYPAGGNAMRKLSNFSIPVAVAVSYGRK